MAWRVSVVRDISHHQGTLNYGAFKDNADDVQIKITESTTFIDNMAQVYFNNLFGMRRAPYHFARPVSFSSQIAHFLQRKAQIGQWERPDMLDCEFSGITGEFIRLLVAEYRKQSGIRRVQVYVGLHDILTSCPPAQWWDTDIYIQVARYRKIGAPDNPDAWRTHLGFDHPGLSTYQWDNAQPFYPGGPVGDISYDRIFVGSTIGESEVELTTRGVIKYPYKNTGDVMEVGEALGFAAYIPADMAKNDDGLAGPTIVDGSNRLSIPALRDDVDNLHTKVDTLTGALEELTNLLHQVLGAGITLKPSGEITVKAE